jgi:flagellar protein FlaG
MDTSLSVQSVAHSYPKPAVKSNAAAGAASSNLSPAVNTTAANQPAGGRFVPVPGGKALPTASNSSQAAPSRTAQDASAARGEEAKPSSELSRLAMALVAEFDSTNNIEKTSQAVAKLNEVLKDRERDLEFSVDDTTGRTILKVIHAESGEVIRQIPPEELLNIARTFIEGTGSLIEDQA